MIHANQLFEMLQEEAGDGGAVILIRAKPGDDIVVLAAGPSEKVAWLLDVGEEYVERYCAWHAQKLLNT